MLNIPVFLASDNNYAPFVAITIASICNNTESFIDFYILDGGISEEYKEKIISLKDQFTNFSIEFISIDFEKEFKNFTASAYLSLATYSRFLIPNLKPQISKAIYLDVDVILQGDIKEFFNKNINNYIIGAIKDQGDTIYITNCKLSMDMNLESPYFNAGVLLINCEAWRENNILQKLLDIEKQYHDKLLCNDQDVLNKCFENNYELLDNKYNSLVSKDNTIIRHFYGSAKPWQCSPAIKTEFFPDKDLFWEYAKSTHFYDELIPKCKYNNPELLRIFSLLKKRYKKTPKVSIIIPVFNTEHYLRQCLDSVCNQTLKDIEIICVNDCSPDNSLNILQEYTKKDSRIKIIDFKENQGVSVARNTGIEMAQGEYCNFIDSDDTINPDFYEILYNKAVDENIDIVKGSLNEINGNYNYITGLNQKIRLNKIHFHVEFTSAIYKTTFIRQNNIIFPLNLKSWEDVVFSLEILSYNPRLAFADEAIYNYVKRPESCSHIATPKYMLIKYNTALKILSYAKNEEDYIILLNTFVITAFFADIFTLADKNDKQNSKDYVVNILNMRPEYSFERDYDKLYKEWLKLKMQSMANIIRKEAKGV